MELDGRREKSSCLNSYLLEGNCSRTQIRDSGKKHAELRTKIRKIKLLYFFLFIYQTFLFCSKSKKNTISISRGICFSFSFLLSPPLSLFSLSIQFKIYSIVY